MCTVHFEAPVKFYTHFILAFLYLPSTHFKAFRYFNFLPFLPSLYSLLRPSQFLHSSSPIFSFARMCSSNHISVSSRSFRRWPFRRLFRISRFLSPQSHYIGSLTRFLFFLLLFWLNWTIFSGPHYSKHTRTGFYLLICPKCLFSVQDSKSRSSVICIV